jgi:hypothetical protein
MANPVSGPSIGRKRRVLDINGGKSSWPLYRPIALALVTSAIALTFVFLANSHSQMVSIGALGFGLLGASAAALIGGFFGFLFALPRDLSRLPAPEPPPPTSQLTVISAGLNQTEADPSNVVSVETDQQGQDRARASWANNNLVKVSDWLTTMVVGVGLVEFGKIVDWLGRIGEKVGAGAGLINVNAQQSFGTSVLIAGFAIGFLVGYIHTRTEVTTTLASTSSAVDKELSSQILSVQQEMKDDLIKVDARMEKQVATVRDELQQRESREIEELIKKRDEITGELRTEADAIRRILKRSAEVLRHLYEAAPAGFEAALRLLDTLLAKPPYNADGRLWAYRACALGQKYRYDASSEAGQQTLPQTADQAFLSVEHAVRMDSLLRPWLRSLWSVEDPAFRNGEDDLTPFWHDAALRARFAKLLDQDDVVQNGSES